MTAARARRRQAIAAAVAAANAAGGAEALGGAVVAAAAGAASGASGSSVATFLGLCLSWLFSLASSVAGWLLLWRGALGDQSRAGLRAEGRVRRLPEALRPEARRASKRE